MKKVVDKKVHKPELTRMQFAVQRTLWKITHIPTAMSLSGVAHFTTESTIAEFMERTLADFKNLVGYGDSDDYEIELS